MWPEPGLLEYYQRIFKLQGKVVFVQRQENWPRVWSQPGLYSEFRIARAIETLSINQSIIGKNTVGYAIIYTKAKHEKSIHVEEKEHVTNEVPEAKEALPASSTVVHFWYMDVLRVGVRTFNSLILSTLESKTRRTGSLSSSSWHMILLSIKDANIWVSRNLERKGR